MHCTIRTYTCAKSLLADGNEYACPLSGLKPDPNEKIHRQMPKHRLNATANANPNARMISTTNLAY